MTTKSQLDAVEIKPDTLGLHFRYRSRRLTFGDGKRPVWIPILHILRRGTVVGIHEGCLYSNQCPSQYRAKKMARRWAEEMRQSRLLIVEVTELHMKRGQARNCSQCAISQALWSAQERWGMAKEEFDFYVNPYGAYTDPEGIRLRVNRWNHSEFYVATGVEALPDVVIHFERDGERFMTGQSLVEWAQEFDEWAEWRDGEVSTAEWAKQQGIDLEEEPDAEPTPPSPMSFVLDLSTFQDIEDP